MENTKELISYLKEKLTSIYPAEEAENIAFLTLEHLYQVTKIDVALNTPITISDNRIDPFLQRLLTHEPIQHVIGSTEFYGLTFEVSNDVLIPRPETEELIDWIVFDYKDSQNLAIIDYCTGSGCIAICLAKELNATIEAHEISDKALNIARKNIENNEVNVSLHATDVLDILDINAVANSYDIIVSNPPYVLDSEKREMHQNVLKYDPHLALFVDNENPLIFYKRLASLALIQLKKGGRLYFEINERFGRELKKLLSPLGFDDIQIRKDLRGKDRMLRATKA